MTHSGMVLAVLVAFAVPSTLLHCPRRAARATVLGLCVCVSVCLFYLNSGITGNKAACERYTRLQRNKRSKNNVAHLAKTAAWFPKKKPAPHVL